MFIKIRCTKTLKKWGLNSVKQSFVVFSYICKTEALSLVRWSWYETNQICAHRTSVLSIINKNKNDKIP